MPVCESSSVNDLGTSLQVAIERGLNYLAASQLTSGEIPCYWSDDKEMSKLNQDSSPFPTALTAYSLSFSDSEQAKKIIAGALRFLVAQQEAGGVWRYWTPVHPYYKYIPVDLDDTACASLVLKQNNIEMADNSRVFTANESSSGFYTWIVPRLKDIARYNSSFWKVVLKQNIVKRHLFFKMHEAASPLDIDGVVNANAAYYLGRYYPRIDLKNVLAYLSGIVQSQKESTCDKWHLSKFNFYYSVSRLHHAGISGDEMVKARALSVIEPAASESGCLGDTALDTALGACALLNFEIKNSVLAGAIQYLLKMQADDGSWPASIYYFGGPQYGGPEKYYGWGSKELTSAFCLEALSRYACCQ